jgi:PAS domain S-box-containing protein
MNDLIGFEPDEHFRPSDMHAQIEPATDEAKHLQRCMNDLLSLFALPAMWSGAGPEQIARALVDALLGMLDLDLVFVRLNPTEDKEAVEMLKTGPKTALANQPQETGAALGRVLGDDPGTWPSRIRRRLAGADLSIVTMRLGVQGDIGVLVAASERPGFAEDSEILLLNVAANQAVIALQGARLLGEQTRLAGNLNPRVAQRTSELVEVNHALTHEVRASEARLVEAERELQLTIDTIPALAWSARPDGSVEFFNQRYQDYVGLSLEQLQGWGWTVAVHPDDLGTVSSRWQAMMASGRAGETEGRLRRFDGEYRWLLFRANPLRDEKGNIVKWYGINTDFEDRKRAESQLGGEKRLLEMIASGRSLRDVLNALCRFVEGATPDCYCGVYPIDWGGPKFQYGVAPSLPASYTDPIGGLPVRCDIAPCGIAAHENIQVIATDMDSDPRWQTSSYRTHVLEHGLRSVWSTPICSQEGRVLGTFCIYQRKPAGPSPRHQALIAHATHIASIAIERSRAETALRRSEALLAEGQRLSLTGTFAWRVDEDEITFSEELNRIFEFGADMVVTLEQIATRVHPDDIGLLSEKIAVARAGGDDLEYEVRLLMPEGRTKYVHAIAHRVPHDDSQLEFLGAVLDITDRRLSEQALDKIRSELAHVTRTMSLGVLTASIAHEVNQPLSGIITNANTCLRMLAANPPNVDGALETARRTIRDGNRASDVIAHLGALFRKKEVVTEAVDLNEATREVIALSGQELQRRRISLQTELDDDLPSVSGDRVQLQQVILNLLLNASDAVKTVDDRPKQIFIRTTCDEDGAARLTVRDSGVGVVAGSLNKLFDAFYTTKADGMGIGLSVSRSIIESHHGRLWCEPNDGPGATFAFSIPVTQSERQATG